MKRWDFGRKPSIKVGDIFMLKCGVEVVVTEYLDYHNVTVTDGVSTVIAGCKALISGGLKWYIDGVKCTVVHKELSRDERTYGLPKKYKIGYQYNTREYGWFEIISIDDKNVTIKFKLSGNEYKHPNNCNFRPRIMKDYEAVGSIRKFKSVKTPFRDEFSLNTYYMSRKDGRYKIISYEKLNSIQILWEDTNTIMKTKAKSIRNNTVSNIENKTSNKSNYLKAKNHYVYCAKHNGIVVYVGKGFGARYTHCNSGRSTSYELNKLHFSGEEVIPEIIIDDLTDDQAKLIEKFYINILNPIGNTVIYSANIVCIENEITETIPESIFCIENAYTKFKMGL